ncbi:MAG TPA: beta-L-arabinofuranosidase domain-containing protein [Blastocatellia bacterium]|nr:beta-L-arabinofuranosidase domain-containing protein [Blastocatellia bacterium]
MGESNARFLGYGLSVPLKKEYNVRRACMLSIVLVMAAPMMVLTHANPAASPELRLGAPSSSTTPTGETYRNVERAGPSNRLVPDPDTDAKLELRNVVELKAHPFNLQEVRLLDGPFRNAMLRDEKYILSLDPDRLLHMYRITAGLPSTAKPLGGWEAPDVELRGHTLGHYLSACALMYSSTGDTQLKTRAEKIVVELAKIQRAMPSRGFHQGYLSAFPEEFFDRVDTRQRVWAPYYTLHKIMAGLLDVYTLCDDRLALDVLTKLADWVGFRVNRLTEEQQQRALQTEFGGMNEVLANLYAVTGKSEYLETARKFNHHAIFDPLARGQDPLDGLHANTQFPKIIGAAREYELTGQKRFYDIAEFFWDRVAHHRSYVTGGNSDGEAFFPVDHFSKHLGPASTETCNVYNMLKLTRHLFAWSPSADTMDFYERGLFNQILASQDPASGMMCYYVPLKPGAFKTFSTADDSFWCCVGTGMENHAKYGDTIYFHDDQSLYINLFIASELDWKEKGLTLRQETRFPEQDSTRLSINCQKPVRLTLKIRYPSWAVSGMTLTINGKEQEVQAGPGSYFAVDREWKNGDVIQVRFPMSLRMEAMPDDPKTIALLYGPIVLAGDLGDEGMEGIKRYGPSAPEIGRVKPIQIPGFVCDLKDVLAKVKPAQGGPLTFQTDGIARPRDVMLLPFYKVFVPRYTVYWKVYSPAEWETKMAEAAAVEAHRKEIERRTVDAVTPGDQDSEQNHGFKGESTLDGDFDGRTFRAARDGWFSYDLKVPPGKAVTLVCTYRGSEGRARAFDVLVDGEKIASEDLKIHPGELFDFEYPLPERLTNGKQRITVRFQSHPAVMTGAVFDVRVIQ